MTLRIAISLNYKQTSLEQGALPTDPRDRARHGSHAKPLYQNDCAEKDLSVQMADAASGALGHRCRVAFCEHSSPVRADWG